MTNVWRVVWTVTRCFSTTLFRWRYHTKDEERTMLRWSTLFFTIHFEHSQLARKAWCAFLNVFVRVLEHHSWLILHLSRTTVKHEQCFTVVPLQTHHYTYPRPHSSLQWPSPFAGNDVRSGQCHAHYHVHHTRLVRHDHHDYGLCYWTQSYTADTTGRAESAWIQSHCVLLCIHVGNYVRSFILFLLTV